MTPADPILAEEQAELSADAGAVARLRGYDEMRRELDEKKMRARVDG